MLIDVPIIDLERIRMKSNKLQNVFSREIWIDMIISSWIYWFKEWLVNVFMSKLHMLNIVEVYEMRSFHFCIIVNEYLAIVLGGCLHE